VVLWSVRVTAAHFNADRFQFHRYRHSDVVLCRRGVCASVLRLLSVTLRARFASSVIWHICNILCIHLVACQFCSVNCNKKSEKYQLILTSYFDFRPVFIGASVEELSPQYGSWKPLSASFWVQWRPVACKSWQNEMKWKCSDLKCVRKPTRSWFSLKHQANKSWSLSCHVLLGLPLPFSSVQFLRHHVTTLTNLDVGRHSRPARVTNLRRLTTTMSCRFPMPCTSFAMLWSFNAAASMSLTKYDLSVVVHASSMAVKTTVVMCRRASLYVC